MIDGSTQCGGCFANHLIVEVGKKGCALVKRDIFELVVKINMPGVRNDVEFLWFRCSSQASSPKYRELGLVSGDEQDRAVRNCLDLHEREEVHQSFVAGTGHGSRGTRVMILFSSRNNHRTRGPSQENLVRNFRFHGLRHTFVTQILISPPVR
jgi:hypothetical protein